MGVKPDLQRRGGGGMTEQNHDLTISQTETLQLCERCNSTNQRVVTDMLDIFYGWWKCYDCGHVGDKVEE